jgi:hypothetical protein
LFWWYNPGDGYDYGNAEQHGGYSIKHADLVYQHGSYQHHDCDHGCNRHRNGHGLTGGCYGGMVFEHDYDQRNTDGLRDL